MNVSLIDHSKGYSVSNIELGLSLTLFLGSGAVYGKRHFELANRPDASKWHRVIACIEFVPVLGGIVALIEWALFRCGCFKSEVQETTLEVQETTLIVRIQHRLDHNPSLQIKPYIDLLKVKEGEVRPPEEQGAAGHEGEDWQKDKFFNEILYAQTAEEFITGLRSLNPPGSQLTWADLRFYLPLLYWVISWQKLLFIESIIQSDEGAKLLNKAFRTPPNYVALTYPIHQAVRRADLKQYRLITEKEAHLKELTARRIVLRLLELNANVNQADAAGRTPLHIAIDIGNFPLAKLLIKEGGTVRFTAFDNGRMIQVLKQHELQELAQLHHELDEEMHGEITTSTPLIRDLSKIVLRYIY